MGECLFNGMSHVGLYVSDLNRSIDFYTKILGFDVELISDRYRCAFIQLGNFRVELIEWTEGAAKGEGVIPHISFDVDNIETVVQCLKEHGLEPKRPDIKIWQLFENGMRFIHFSGPDGEDIELTQIL